MADFFESQGIELKARIENFREISKTACAMANAFGGKIIIGVSNEGRAIGIPESELDSLQQRIEGAIQQVSPVPFHKILVEEKEGKKLVSTEIYQMGQGAFCTFGGIAYYRTGSRNTKLEGRTLQDFMVKRRILSFDELASGAKLEDADPEKLKEFLQKRTPALIFEKSKTQEYLENLGAGQKNGEFKLNNTGVLFFAKEPSKFLPQNEIKLARFKGNEPVVILDSKFLGKTLLENLYEAENFIQRNTRTGFVVEGLERKETPEYPREVIREALVNAVAHRDYFSRDAIQINVFENRIEFINPGTLPAGLSIKILGTLSVQRNPLTYRLLRDIRLVEGLATGIPRMRAKLMEAKLPEPSFEELGNFFRVTIYNGLQRSELEFGERKNAALAYIEKNPSITSKAYAKITGVSYPIAVSDLNELCKEGKLKKVGKTRGAYYIKPEAGGGT
jgi:ATP-dependent DNA helicase RecG